MAGFLCLLFSGLGFSFGKVGVHNSAAIYSAKGSHPFLMFTNLLLSLKKIEDTT